MNKISAVKHIDDFGFKELEIGRTYSSWIYSIVAPYFSQRVMEVGCGLGLMAQHYAEGRNVLLTDVNKKYIRIVKERYANNKNINARYLDITRIGIGELRLLKEYEIECVFSVNVLEHIENDSLALSNIYKILGKKGKIILFVPALQGIYGTLDRGFGHYRRYSRDELMGKLRQAGFKQINIRYFNSIGVIWWYIAGKILKKENIPPMSGILLKFIVPILKTVEAVIRPVIGQSLIAVASKK